MNATHTTLDLRQLQSGEHSSDAQGVPHGLRLQYLVESSQRIPEQFQNRIVQRSVFCILEMLTANMQEQKHCAGSANHVIVILRLHVCIVLCNGDVQL